MADFLDEARHLYRLDSEAGFEQIQATALIAIAEELRKLREQPEIVPITVYVNADNAGPEQIREVAKHIDEQIKRRRR